MQWLELISLLDLSNDLHKLSTAEQGRMRAKLLNDNPAIAAWFLQMRVKNFFKYYLNYEFSVVDYWYRFEWQNRGSGHVHWFLWLKDSPNVSQIATNDELRKKVIDYFDKLVCIENPDINYSNPIHPCARLLPIEANLDTDHDDYASLVNWVMRHTKCGIYCLRLHKTTKQMVCRFRFPFDVLEKSEIIEELRNSEMFRFMGCRNDLLLGSHNRKVLQTWRANIDWSPVLSVQSVVNYIAKYAAKAEPASKSFTDTLRGIVSDLRRPCQNIKSAIKRLLIKSVSESDISAQEVCHLLMGYPLTHSSRKIILLNVSEHNMLSTTVRRSRGENSDGTDVGTDSGFVSRYLQRPSKYADTSLYSMAQKHYFKNNCWHDYRTNAVVRVVPELDGKIPQNNAKWESFCCQQVLLHFQYRSVEEAKGQCESWAERYNNLGFAETQVNILPEPIDDDLDGDIGTEAGTELLQREEWMIAASMGPLFLSADNVELGMRDFDISHNWAEGFQRYPNIEAERKFVQNNLRGAQEMGNEVMNDDHFVGPDNLSIQQNKALDLIIKSLQNGMPIQLIVCGGAGTGKSTLINAIVKSAATCFGNKKMVRIMAPTGVAAFNIGGTTIHHELSISSERRFFLQYKHISGDQCRKMQDDFKETKLIIIDEYSMLGRAMLANIDLRCRDIFAKNEAFGGVSVVLVGDLRQLPPVFDSPLYGKKGTNMQQYGGIAYTGFDKCVYLSQIFRQAGIEQVSFREALHRLSDGTSTIKDWHLFKTRDSTLLTPVELNTFKFALRLFPTKQAAHDYNCKRLVDLGKPIARVHSKNNCATASSAMSDDAKGLEK
ncbi:Atp-dependent dna helicase rrm3, partial [Thalictrum thalictroides]